ncbi:MAG: NUDIX hydrolase [Candidatus Sericytochromatia bacterium]|nr:NUDIX hydrolase [Candidatus Sericytochromatia bacterium]
MSSDFFKPAVTVDVLVLCWQPTPQILLIQRKNAPFAGAWALPGGFLDATEPLHEAARRELQEETGLNIPEVSFFGVYGEPARDPRGRTLTLAYLTLLEVAAPVSGQDDARDARWFTLKQLPELAFDHARIVRDGLKDLRCRLENRHPEPLQPKQAAERLKQLRDHLTEI